MRRPKLLVVSSTKELDKKALALSKKVMLPFFGNLESLKINSMNSLSGYFLVVSRDFIYLKRGLTNKSNPIFCNFLKWNKEGKRNNLIKTMRGLPRQSVIIDATAGFGKDALVFSSLVKKVILIERVPWMSSLLEDGIKNSKELLPNLMNTKLFCSDSKEYLSGLKSKPDAIYIDPIFGNKSKSKAKSEVQALRDLTIQTKEEELLVLALKKAKNRVVVKRHRKTKNLAGLKPTYSLKGRVIRYDIYSLKLS